jgi:hypothetical protein
MNTELVRRTPELWPSPAGGRGVHYRDQDFHDHRRCVLGRTGRNPPMIGRAVAIEWTCEAIRKAIEAGHNLPANLTEERVRAMLQDGYELLDKLWPLGTAPSQHPSAAAERKGARDILNADMRTAR